MKFPTKPRIGEKTLQSFYKSICQIIDYLPALTVKGNFGGIGVTQTTDGQIISNSEKQVYPDIYHEKPTQFYSVGLKDRWLTITQYTQYDLKSNLDARVRALAVTPDIEYANGTLSTGQQFMVGGGMFMQTKSRYINDSTDPYVDRRACNDYVDMAIKPYLMCDNIYISGWVDKTMVEDEETGEEKFGPQWGAYKIQWIGPNIDHIASSYMRYPDYQKLGTSNPPGSGQGISFLYPIRRNTPYGVATNTSASFVQAKFAPPVGYTGNPVDVSVGDFHGNPLGVVSSNNDGYLKVTVFDDGTHNGGCVRLIENVNERAWDMQWDTAYPIYKFSSFSGSSGSGVIPYTSLTPNMLTVNNSNYTLSAASYTSLTPNLLSIDNTNHTISAASSGSAGGGMPWPNYANLDNNSGNQIMNYTRYQAGAGGGWLRISYKGQMTDDCYYVKIGPDGTNDPTIGLWRIQNGYGYYGQIGNTWLLPVPPNNYIYVSFPSNVTTAWFDSSLSPDSPQPVPPSMHGYIDDINNNFRTVSGLADQARDYYQECITKTNYDDANEYAQYAESCASDANYYATDSETKNTALISYGITDYTTKVTNTRNQATLAEGYAGQARQYAEGLRDT